MTWALRWTTRSCRATPSARWRTAPLTGLRLRHRYLHDGRAATLRDAILSHGGEAEIVRNRFFDLGEADQQAIKDFVSKL